MKESTGQVLVKIIAAIVIILIGCVFFINGFGFSQENKLSKSLKTSYVSKKEYGGEAYTGIQNAEAQTANNVHYLNEKVDEFLKEFNRFAEKIQEVIGLLLIVLGLEKLFIIILKPAHKEVKQQSNE